MKFSKKGMNTSLNKTNESSVMPEAMNLSVEKIKQFM